MFLIHGWYAIIITMCYGILCVIIRLAVSIQYRLVTDRQTDRQTDGHRTSIYRASIASHGKNCLSRFSVGPSDPVASLLDLAPSAEPYTFQMLLAYMVQSSHCPTTSLKAYSHRARRRTSTDVDVLGVNGPSVVADERRAICYKQTWTLTVINWLRSNYLRTLATADEPWRKDTKIGFSSECGTRFWREIFLSLKISEFLYYTV